MKRSEDIYGKDTDGAGKVAQDQAMRRMGPLGKTDKAAKSDGPDTSDSSDITGNLGSAKP
jgi:hypothetical protein